MLRGQGEQAGSEGMSWGLPKAPGKFKRPRDAQGARGASWEQGSELAPQVYGSMCIQLHAYMAPCVYSSMRIWLHAYTTPCVYGSMRRCNKVEIGVYPFSISTSLL